MGVIANELDLRKADGGLVRAAGSDSGHLLTADAAVLALLNSLIASGRLKVDTELQISELGQLVVENVRLKNVAGDAINPATEETLGILAGAGKTFVPAIVLTAADATQVLAAADAGRRYHVAGIEISEIAAGVTALKLVDSDGATVWDFGAFATGGDLSFPPLRDFNRATATAGKGVSLTSTGGAVKGLVYLAWEAVA